MIIHLKLYPKTLRDLVHHIRYLKLIKPRQVCLLLSLMIVATLLEGFSITMLLPILQFIESGRNIEQLAQSSTVWTYIVQYHAFIGVPITLISLMVSVLILALLRQLFYFLKNMYSIVVGEGALLVIRKTGFRAFLTADMDFFAKKNVGSMMNVFMLDGICGSSAFLSLFQSIGFCLVFVVYFLILTSLSLSITLWATLIIASIGILLSTLLKRSKTYGLKITQYNKKFSENLVERLGAIKLIKLIAGIEREFGLQERIVKTLYRQKLNITLIKGIIDSTIQISVLLGALTVLFLSVEIFHMSLAEVSLFIFILLRFLPLAKEFFIYAESIASNTNSLVTVSTLVKNATESNTIRGGPTPFVSLKDKIQFTNISFKYASSKSDILKNLTLTIPANKITAIAGRSGAGKSTLVNMIPRLIVPNGGEITFDGTPHSRFTLDSLRSSIAFVSQEGFLFDTTVLENIRYGRPEAPLDEVKEAARQAYIAGFIESLPLGYETQIGERGIKLSGGERQRISLARALLQKAPIIILDEPTSSLDLESEAYIQKAIENLRHQQKITLIIIAHRLSTIKNADRIVVIDEGRIVESGNHNELIHGDEWYGDMFRLQTGTAGA